MLIFYLLFKVRTLGCASLVAASCSNKNQLWLIDATGAYRVRAHALGGNIIHGDDDNGDGGDDGNLNEKLCEHDFLSLSCTEGLQILKNIIAKRKEGLYNIECAIIDSKTGKLVRR